MLAGSVVAVIISLATRAPQIGAPQQLGAVWGHLNQGEVTATPPMLLLIGTRRVHRKGSRSSTGEQVIIIVLAHYRAEWGVPIAFLPLPYNLRRMPTQVGEKKQLRKIYIKFSNTHVIAPPACFRSGVVPRRLCLPAAPHSLRKSPRKGRCCLPGRGRHCSPDYPRWRH